MELNKYEQLALEIIWNDGYGSVPRKRFDEFAQPHLSTLLDKGLIEGIGMWWYYEADKPYSELGIE